MKKIVAGLFTLVTIASFAQTSPTKGETLKWIVSKIKADNRGFRTDEGYVYYYEIISEETGFIKWIKDAPGYPESKSSGYIKLDKLTWYTEQHYVEETWKKWFRLSKSDYDACIYLHWDKEVDLFNRFDKALNSLLKLNTPKEAY